MSSLEAVLAAYARLAVLALASSLTEPSLWAPSSISSRCRPGPLWPLFPGWNDHRRTPPTPIETLKLFKTFGVSRPPGAFLPCFFLADVATATAPAAPPSAEESIQRIWRDGLMLGGVGGAMIFYLIWLVTRRLLGKKVKSKMLLFCGSPSKITWGWYWSIPVPTRFYPNYEVCSLR